MSLYSTITCYEEFGTASENRTLESWTAQVTLRCSWANRYLLMNDLLGSRREWPHGTGDKPRCVSCAINPFATQYTVVGQCITYEDALVDVKYSTDAEEDLIAESLEPSAEFATLDHKLFRWNSANGDALEQGEAPGRLLRSLSLNRTLYEVDSIPNTVLTAVGKCNSAAYTSNLLGLTFAEETLMFSPPSMDRTVTTSGSKGWTLNMKFLYKPQGWNKFWRAKSQDWEEIWLADPPQQYKPYEPDNFGSLLQ